MIEQTFVKIRGTLAVLLGVCFLASLTAGTVSATIGDGHDLQSSWFHGNAVLEACYDNEKVLKKGNTGSAVSKLQSALMSLGYSIPDGPTTYFGDQTQNAVKSFQRDNGLSASGIVGPITIGTLDSYLS